MSNNTILMTNTWAELQGPALWTAKEVLKYRAKGYNFSRAFKLGVWDGWTRIINAKGQFAAGLVPWLVERLEKEGISIEVIDQRPEPLPVSPLLAGLPATDNSKLRSYQWDACNAGLEKQRGLVHQPTGAGKTEVMIELTKSIGRPALILVHRKDLMHQTVERFRQVLGVDSDVVGIIGDGMWEPRVITVATFQTLYLRVKEKIPEVLRWLREDIGHVAVDEAHHLPAKSFEKVMAQLWAARWRLGYSATPDKEGDVETFFKVSSWLGPTIHRVFAKELTDEGYLAPTDVFLIKIPGKPARYQTWQEAVAKGIVDNSIRNRMIVELAQSLPKPVVILVERLQHGEKLARALGTAFIAGNSPTGTRKRAWEAIRQGKQDILITSKIADEGLDIPQIKCLILAGGGKAPHVTIQRVGRGMRVADGKDRLFVFDFLDTGTYLGTHARKRRQTYADQPAYEVVETNFQELEVAL
ncbi:hypothetical protein LCGC14_0294520 [marine sediment metagenome]|uniref:Helicase ATP-binding domain-containing protein n=1 Tax=marine sediment metagenome TaxID=412755 RepID=A0A0F9TWZ1_9ZZZZ